MGTDTDDTPEDRAALRRQDGAIYKLMAAFVFCIVGLPLGEGLTRGLKLPGTTKLLLAFFIFDAGWDFLMRAAGRSDLVASASPWLIVGRALEHIAVLGIVMLAVLLEGDLRTLALTVLVAWIAGDTLTRRGSR